MQRNDRSGGPPSSRGQSALEGVGAFIAEILAAGYEKGLLDPKLLFDQEFLTARALMRSLSGSSALRGCILHKLRYDDEPISFDLPVEVCGDILHLLITQGMIKPEEVLNTMTPEQCARYLDHRLLWSFATARPVWHGIRKGVDPQILRAESDYLAVILFSALKHGLITETDVVDGIGVGELRKLLFSWQQEDLFDKIRESCGTGTSIDHVILEKITLITVVRRIPKILWGKVVNPKIEVVYGLWSTRPPDSARPGPNEISDTTYSFIYGR